MCTSEEIREGCRLPVATLVDMDKGKHNGKLNEDHNCRALLVATNFHTCRCGHWRLRLVAPCHCSHCVHYCAPNDELFISVCSLRFSPV